jgi:uncharacterized protein YbjQ (UPF0145 family)
MNKSGVLITTSQTVEGFELVRHIDIVSAQVVQGAGLVSEFFAGFTDVFGGRSRAFQNQLDIAKDGVIELLREKVKRIGGNALIGFRIDFEEISGKNTQMFMVSASGMAVSIAKSSASPEREDVGPNGSVSASEVEYRITLKDYIDRINEKTLQPSDDFWRFLIQSRDPKFARWAFDYLSKRWMPGGFQSYEYTTNKVMAFDYLVGIDPETLCDLIHLEIGEKSSWGTVLEFAKQNGIVDFARCKEWLCKEDIGVHKRAITLLQITKAVYTQADVIEMESLCGLIEGQLIKERTFLEVKKMIGTKEVWVCPSCSKHVAATNSLCQECGSDGEGFFNNEMNYTEVSKLLRQRIVVVRSLLSGEGEPTEYLQDLKQGVDEKSQPQNQPSSVIPKNPEPVSMNFHTREE